MATLHRGFSPSSILILLLVVASSSASPVHEIVTKYKLPQGIFPDTAKNYSLSSNGKFVVRLGDPCEVVHNDVFHYDRTIWGKLEKGRFSQITGIMRKKAFIWLPVTGIVAPNQDFVVLLFELIAERYPIKLFEEIPSCMAKSGCSGHGRADDSLPISEV